jgi:hypothetical protein
LIIQKLVSIVTFDERVDLLAKNVREVNKHVTRAVRVFEQAVADVNDERVRIWHTSTAVARFDHVQLTGLELKQSLSSSR